MKISDIDAKFKEDTEDISEWIENLYDTNFSQYFEDVKHLYKRVKSETRPITDNELESILTSLPLELFAVSETLNTFKAKLEVIKLKTKQLQHKALMESEETSQSARRESAAYQVIEDQALIKAYTTLIDRVESEISFSRELIMSAKKIWSSRRQAETIGIGSEDVDVKKNVSINLPEYSNMVGKDYIQ